MSEWRETKLGSLGKVITGKTPSKDNPEDWGDAVLFVTPSDYKNYRKKADSSLRMLSVVGADRQKQRLLPAQSVLVTCIGSDMGKTVVNALPCVTNQQINAIIPNESVIDPDYLYYITKDLYSLLSILGSDGTAVPILNKSDFENIDIIIPAAEVQKSIATVLSSLDDKIDLLHRQNKTLEAMAETLFRQWFLEGVGEWEPGTLGEVIEIFDGKRIPLSSMERAKKKEGVLYPYYGAAKIMDYINDYIFDGEYILLGEDGTVRTEEGYPVLQYATGKFWVNNHTHVLRAKPPYSNFFLWNYLVKKNIDEIVTGAVQPKINQGNLKSLDFPKFPQKLVEEYNQISEPMLTKINRNKNHIGQLEQLRDGLLPKLMSGEVRVG